MTAPVDELLPAARELVAEEGSLPSKESLKKSLRIGWPKAVEIHERLAAELPVETPSFGPGEGTPGGGSTSPGPLPDRPDPAPAVPVSPQVGGSPDLSPEVSRRVSRPWPILVLALPAFVAIWSGWVDLGRLTGFGVVHPLPGIWDGLSINTAITLPVGLEAYSAYALRVWLGEGLPAGARRFAKWSALGSLGLGAAGQVVYHLMIAAGWTAAPWPVTTAVACIPVAVLGMGAALWHLTHRK